MEFDIIKIDLDLYRKMSNILNNDYSGTWLFDFDCGIEYISNNGDGSRYFTFKIIDKHKYFLAKIKHGI